MSLSLGEKLKQWRGGTRPPFYNQPQTFKVQYKATVRNTSGKMLSAYVVLPVPSQTAYQIVRHAPIFFPENVIIKREPAFGNQYAYWQLKFAPCEQKIVCEECIITISPRTVSIPDSLTINNYHLANLTSLTRLNLVRFQNSYVDAGNEQIKKIAQEVIGKEQRVSEIITRLNEYVITRLIYGNPIKGLHSSKNALEKEKVDCGGFDTLLAALCIAAGIPARIVSGFWAGYKKNDMHAWLEIMLPNDEWVSADPSVEHLARQGRTKKIGQLGFIGSDRVALSVGCGIPITVGKISLALDILQNPTVVSQEKRDLLVLETKFITHRMKEI